MLAFDGPMGQCFSAFPTVPQRSRGRGKGEDRYGIDWKSEFKQSHTAPTSTVGLCVAFPTCIRPLNVCNSIVFSLLPTHPSEILQTSPEVFRPRALTQPYYVLVALADTMRLYGIHTPDPVALTGFSGVIRPLSIMLYAAKGGMAIKSMVL